MYFDFWVLDRKHDEKIQNIVTMTMSLTVLLISLEIGLHDNNAKSIALAFKS